MKGDWVAFTSDELRAILDAFQQAGWGVYIVTGFNDPETIESKLIHSVYRELKSREMVAK
jgi:hypothetical protein